MLSNPAFLNPVMTDIFSTPQSPVLGTENPPNLQNNQDGTEPHSVTINGDLNIMLTDQVIHELARILSGAIEKND